jgi:cell division protein FtsW
MVTSASISIASKDGGDAFSFLERQLVLCLVGSLLAALVFCIRTEYLEKMAWPLLIVGAALLFVVLIPASATWSTAAAAGSAAGLQLPGLRAGARAGADLHRQLRRAPRGRAAHHRVGLIKPIGCCSASSRCCCWPSRISARVGAVHHRLRHPVHRRGAPALRVAGGGGGAAPLALLVLLVPYRMARVTSFLDPWADPYNSGFQLTQSLIAIGRGEWFGVGLGESVQKLFYLPEAHTDFLFAVLAEELGLVGVAATLALFIGLVWRSFWIAQLASRAGLKFQAYLARGFGLWLGPGADQHRREHGRAAHQGADAAAHELRRSSMIVTLAWSACCCACTTRPCRARAAWRPRVVRTASFGDDPRPCARRSRRMSAPQRCSSWRAARAATCSRRWRWRACCARLARSRVAGTQRRHSKRAWCRAENIASSGCR